MPATVKDLSHKTGLGLATISKYLNGGMVREKNRVSIERAIDELSFERNEIARALKTNRSYTIGVILPELNNVFFTSIVSMMSDLFRERGYGTIVCDCRSDLKQEADIVKFVLGKRVDGIIDVPVGNGISHLTPAIKRGIPIVLLDRRTSSENVTHIFVDNEEKAYQITKILTDNQHRRIGILCGPRELYTTKERLAGYVRALSQAGVELNPDWVIYTKYDVDGAYAGMEKLLAVTPAISAVFSTNREISLGMSMALSERGKSVPEDLSAVTFDSVFSPVRYSSGITAVHQPYDLIAKTASEVLLGRFAGEQMPNTIQLEAEIIIGNSVKKWEENSG